MTQLDKLAQHLTDIGEFDFSEGWEKELAQKLMDSGVVVTTSDPSEFLTDTFEPIPAQNIQNVVNFVLERQKDEEKKAEGKNDNEFDQGDYVLVLKDGTWLEGQVSEVTVWGTLDVATERGPVSVTPGSSRVKHQVAPVS